MKQYAIVIDADRCIGCRGGCQVACKIQNEIALGPSRSKFYSVGPTGQYPNLQMYFLPVMCQQCENPACAAVCPTGACYKNPEDGVIAIDQSVCVGCQSCLKACPYDAVIFKQELRVSDKCDICAPLREVGEKPVCVKNCSGAAIHFGDINDPQSDIAKLLAGAGENAYALRDDAAVKPSGRFILRKAKWIDALPSGMKGGSADE